MSTLAGSIYINPVWFPGVMDENVLRGLGSVGVDPHAQQRVLQYFNELKSSPDGWKICASNFTTGQWPSNEIRFFCLQVIEDFLKHRYKVATIEDQQNIKALLLLALKVQADPEVTYKSYLLNKVAQIFSLAFVVDYPQRWSSFFTDLFQSLTGPGTVDLYLRIMLAIDSEVVDREIVHSPQESERNTMIKDSIREQCVGQLVDSWYQILTSYEKTHPQIVCMCLDVIGRYVSWVDISLIANDRLVLVLLEFMKNKLLRESTCDCIHEIISKGMDPVAKTKLVESFATVLDSAGVMNVSEDEEGDYMAKLAKLVNGMGTNLVVSWQKLVKAGDLPNANFTLQAIENKVPLLLTFLGDEDDDVSSAVISFAQDYINVLKQMNPISPTQRENMERLLCVLVKKMKYDESYNFEQEGEDEAMFQEYRKQIKVLFNNLAQLDSGLILVTVHNINTRTLSHWKTSAVSDIEVAIYLLHLLGEAVPASHSQHFTGDLTKVTVLQEMMRLLVTSRVSCQGHMMVLLSYFETVVRYEKFFNVEPQHIPDVLMSFLDERGLRNPSAQVRSRVAYLFSRFVKGLKHHLQSFLEDILKRLQDLLILNSPDNGYQHLLSSEDQLFVYETAGLLIVHSSLPTEKKKELMRRILAPIVEKFEGLLAKACVETDETKQLLYAQCLHTAMSLASRVSKGFSSQQTMKLCDCVKPFTEVLQVFLQVLSTPVHRQLLHAGVRQFLHRMVVCLGEEILPYIPVAMENLLKYAGAKELHDFIPLMNQLIMKFKDSFVPFLQKVFMPLVRTIFQVLSEPVEEGDQVSTEDKRLLQRSYFLLISTIVSQNVFQVFTYQEASDLQQVMMTLIQGAMDNPDPQGQKMCFGILKRMVDVWGGKGGLEGFEDFMYKNIVPACFMAPVKPTFELGDAQTILALGESAACMKSILDKQGEAFVTYLQTEYLPTLNISPQGSQEYCQALKADLKTYKNFLKVFFARAKS
ncbi:exportin-T-like isoform X2 [Liolophura sinensis]|uniref:exportin-T-like isoform X2 n=1 Tax=Liolophura sinensis TaxID=3198878 RepID=UPI003158E306